VQVKHLPQVIHKLGEVDTSNLEPPGLLYLNNKYVVPGGRFNEMYGWDSYFIVRGLVEDQRIELARGIGGEFFLRDRALRRAVLNANRTYYLTRSQPPFLTSMIWAVYDARSRRGRKTARGWNEVRYAARDYSLWTREPIWRARPDCRDTTILEMGQHPRALKMRRVTTRQVAGFFLTQPQDEWRDYVVPQRADQAHVGPLFALQVCDSTKAMGRLRATPQAWRR